MTSMKTVHLLDWARGTLLGLAVGDGLGAAVEFQPRGSFVPVSHYRGGGPHGLAPGEWTDDTSMALALADSLAQAGWDLNDQARRYLLWWRQGTYSITGSCFDIGTTTVRGLSRFETTGDAVSSGATGPNAVGNGSIMRLAPVPIRYQHLYRTDPAQLVRLCADSSLPTHGHPDCVAACAYLGLLLAALMEGEQREVILSPGWDKIRILREQGCWTQNLDHILRDLDPRRSAETIRGSGHVLECLEAALWAFSRADSFSMAVLGAVNLGEDADTTGAVCGQLAGAYWGETGIPAKWLAELGGRSHLERALAGILP